MCIRDRVGGFFAAGPSAGASRGGREGLVGVQFAESVVEFLQGGDHGEGVTLGSADGEPPQVPADVLAHLSQGTLLAPLVGDAPRGVALDHGDHVRQGGAGRDGCAVVGGHDVAEDPGSPLRSPSDADAVAPGALEHVQGVRPFEEVAVAEDGNVEEFLQSRDVFPLGFARVVLGLGARVQRECGGPQALGGEGRVGGCLLYTSPSPRD